MSLDKPRAFIEIVKEMESLSQGDDSRKAVELLLEVIKLIANNSDLQRQAAKRLIEAYHQRF